LKTESYDLVDLMPVCKIAIHYVVVSAFYATICCILKFNIRLNQQSHHMTGEIKWVSKNHQENILNSQFI
jgi:hypothetical protein